MFSRQVGAIVVVKRLILVACFGIDLARVALFVADEVKSARGCTLRVVPVVVAVRDLPEGVLIDSAAVVVEHWPQGTQPAGAYASVDAVAGRVSGRDIHKGEALATDRLAP